jgi:hypothetical protein
MFRKLYMFALLMLVPYCLNAQSGDYVYQFLSLPYSVSASGLGGISVSSVEKDLNLCFQNPAILSTEMSNNLAFGYMHYIADINIGSMAYARKINDRSIWMAGVRYVDYGSMLWTSAEDDVLGTTNARDLALTGTYSWMLSEHWRAGGNVSFVYSALDEYTSAAIGVDVGLYYHNPENLVSAGLVIKNLGAQIVSYDGTYESLPRDVQIGITKKLAHAPFRFTLTAQNLLDLKLPYLAENATTSTDSSSSKGFFDKLFKHLIVGVEFVPTDNFLLSLGYNYRRVSELGVNQRTAFGGFTAGFSMHMKNKSIGASYAKYNMAGGSLQMTLNIDLSK